MNIINNVYFKKIKIIHYKKQHTTENIKDNVNINNNVIKPIKKNIYNEQIQKIQDIQISKEVINTENIEENLNDINKKLITSIENTNRNQNPFNVFALIGHNVLVPSSKIIYTKNTNVVYGYFLPQDTTSTLIQIKNQNNQLVFSHLVGPQKSGNYVHAWNGEIDNISTLDTGSYDISIQSENESGLFSIQPLVEGTVQSIDTPNEHQYKVNLGPMGIVDILDIKRIL